MDHAHDAAEDSGAPSPPSHAPSASASASPAVHAVELHPQGWRFDAPEDQTLLLAALDHGLRLPHSCRNGTCRACIAKLASGRVEYRIEWPGLSREEKDEGWILPCVACARSDLVMDQPQTINLFDVPPPPGPGPRR
ncbi:2Fe-2S iron-sulfur cluster-binding protein [Roseateles sp. UC29_93]|uniref:2Fe-2S iron-sulfur cluster-binding protein n=1 Tax=Roseateles sp. UC29_93 TaxID=3350177 RepID=UPI0036735293